jgi:hypothetical protein
MLLRRSPSPQFLFVAQTNDDKSAKQENGLPSGLLLAIVDTIANLKCGDIESAR